MRGSFSTQSIDAIQGVFDFVTCQRKDGSFYGNQGAKCVIGTEAKISVNAPLNSKVSEFLNRNTEAIKKFFGYDPAPLARPLERFADLRDEYRQKIEKGELTLNEVEDMILHNEEYDISKASFVLIGQEAKSQADEKAVIQIMADNLASREMMREGFSMDEATTARRVSEWAPRVDDGTFRSNSYVGVAANLVRAASGQDDAASHPERIGGYFGGRQMASIEMANVPAWSTVYGANDKITPQGVSGLDPRYSGYAILARQRDPQVSKLLRREVAKTYAARRAEVVRQSLMDAAQQPHFRGAMAVPGKTEYKRFQKEVLDKFWNGKTGASSNIRQVSIPLTTTGGAKTNNILTHVVDLGNGKFLTSHAITLVTQGYQSGQKINELRTKAISAWMNGEAKPYTPPSK